MARDQTSSQGTHLQAFAAQVLVEQLWCYLLSCARLSTSSSTEASHGSICQILAALHDGGVAWTDVGIWPEEDIDGKKQPLVPFEYLLSHHKDFPGSEMVIIAICTGMLHSEVHCLKRCPVYHAHEVCLQQRRVRLQQSVCTCALFSMNFQQTDTLVCPNSVTCKAFHVRQCQGKETLTKVGHLCHSYALAELQRLGNTAFVNAQGAGDFGTRALTRAFVIGLPDVANQMIACGASPRHHSGCGWMLLIVLTAKAGHITMASSIQAIMRTKDEVI